MGAGQGRGARGRARPRCSSTSPTAFAASPWRSPRSFPRTSAAILEALGQPQDVGWENVAPGKDRPPQPASRPRRRCSRGSTRRPRRDRHARASRRVRGAGAGAPRPGARGRRRAASSRWARESTPAARRSPIAGSEDGVACALGIHPHQAEGRRRVGWTSSRSSSRSRRPWPSARPGSTSTATTHPHDAQRRRVRAASSRSPPISACPSSCTPATPTTRPPITSRRSTARSCSTASRRPRCSTSRSSADYYVSFAGNVTFPKAAELATPRPRVSRRTGSSSETDCPYLAPQPVRGRPNEPAYVVHTVTALAALRGETAETLARPDRRERDVAPSACREPPDRVSAKRELGQHFLVDENILGVIGRLADLRPGDVVLEIGPGLGVLTRYLADRVARVVGRRDRPQPRATALRAARRAPTNVDLVYGDALALDLAALDPPPGKLVANLPYNVATPIVVESLDGLPEHRTLVRDGAARGRRPVLRRARYEGLRRGVRACPARDGARGVPSRRAEPCSGPAPTSTRPSSPSRGVPLPPDYAAIKRIGSGSVRASAEDPAELARPVGSREPGARRRRAGRSSASAPRCGPRRSVPSSSSSSPGSSR